MFACAGWLAKVGHRHPAVRLAMISGRRDPAALEPGVDWPELHENYREVLYCGLRFERPIMAPLPPSKKTAELRVLLRQLANLSVKEWSQETPNLVERATAENIDLVLCLEDDWTAYTPHVEPVRLQHPAAIKVELHRRTAMGSGAVLREQDRCRKT